MNRVRLLTPHRVNTQLCNLPVFREFECSRIDNLRGKKKTRTEFACSNIYSIVLNPPPESFGPSFKWRRLNTPKCLKICLEYLIGPIQGSTNDNDNDNNGNLLNEPNKIIERVVQYHGRHQFTSKQFGLVLHAITHKQSSHNEHLNQYRPVLLSYLFSYFFINLEQFSSNSLPVILDAYSRAFIEKSMYKVPPIPILANLDASPLEAPSEKLDSLFFSLVARHAAKLIKTDGCDIKIAANLLEKLTHHRKVSDVKHLYLPLAERVAQPNTPIRPYDIASILKSCSKFRSKHTENLATPCVEAATQSLLQCDKIHSVDLAQICSALAKLKIIDSAVYVHLCEKIQKAISQCNVQDATLFMSGLSSLLLSIVFCDNKKLCEVEARKCAEKAADVISKNLLPFVSRYIERVHVFCISAALTSIIRVCRVFCTSRIELDPSDFLVSISSDLLCLHKGTISRRIGPSRIAILTLEAWIFLDLLKKERDLSKVSIDFIALADELKALILAPSNLATGSFTLRDIRALMQVCVEDSPQEKILWDRLNTCDTETTCAELVKTLRYLVTSWKDCKSESRQAKYEKMISSMIRKVQLHPELSKKMVDIVNEEIFLEGNKWGLSYDDLNQDNCNFSGS